MATGSGVRPPPPLKIGDNLIEDWKIFKQTWENYEIIADLSSKEQRYQKAMFLHCVGPEALKIYNTFNLEETAELADIISRFEAHIIGETNITYERYKFNQRSQKTDESAEQYITALRTLAATCDFCDCMRESLIRDRLVTGIRNADTRKKLLEQRNLTLNQAIDILKSAEASASQTREIDSKSESINRLRSGSPSDNETVSPKCKYCGGKHKFLKSLCPAYNQTCGKCGLKNHFAKMCRSKNTTRRGHGTPKNHKVRYINEMSSDSEAENEWVNSVDRKTKTIKCNMTVKGQKTAFLIDTGASVNLLPERLATHLVGTTTHNLRSYCNSRVETKGTSRQTIINPKNGRKYSVEFVIVNNESQPVLGLKAARSMHLIDIKAENFDLVASLTLENQKSTMFEDGIGTFSGEQHLTVNPSVKPVVMPDRRVPIALRDKLKSELERLSGMGVICPVTEPTPWVSQMVVTRKKNGQLRICIDPKYLNEALQRERFTMPHLDDVLHELSQSKIFTKVDLRNGFWHVVLDEESSKLTTFQTYYGRYRWLRLPFGLSVSPEIFQRKVLEIFGGLPGIVAVHDDIIIHGTNKSEHDERLRQFLGTCEQHNVKLNKEKLELAKSSIIFMGHVISDKGVSMDPEKGKAVRDFPAPKSVPELRRFLGMVQYLARYIPKLSDMIHALQNLTKKGVIFTWSTTQQAAFDAVKNAIDESSQLAIFDPNKELHLENDASEYGLGSVLTQDGKPLAFASRTLSPAEKNYAQIEKEMLAITYGLKKFHTFTYGRLVQVITDHKPLVSITRKPLCKTSRRLQNMLLKVQEYNYSVSYKPGTQMLVSDCLSRAPVPDASDWAEETISNLDYTPINNQRLNEIKAATVIDPVLNQLKVTIVQGWPNEKAEVPTSILPYFSYRDELTVQDGIVLRGERIVIPQSLRLEMKTKVHAGHQGINSCLRRARNLIFWPGMSADIRTFIESCETCATHSFRQPEQPLQMHEVPEHPWQKVGSDIFTIQGRNYLVTVDYFSQYIEVDFLPDTTSTTVITKLKHHFARYGIPSVLVSDNGPQFSSHEFQKFTQKWNLVHNRIAPGNSRANGQAESAVKIIKSMMIKCRASNEDPYLGLLNIRNTPNEGLQTSPAQRLMGRRTQTMTPSTTSALKPSSIPVTEHSKMRLKRLQSAQTLCARKTLPPLKVGDNVRMEPIDGKREWREATVTKTLPFNTYEARDGNRHFIRARKFLRKKPTSDANPQNDASETSSPQPIIVTTADASQQLVPTPRTPIPNTTRDSSGPTEHQQSQSPPTPMKDMGTTPTTTRTRSGRIVKPPIKFNI